jgi:uncharacterized protein
MSIAASSAISLIELYQRYISPRKGYVCACRVLHGGSGCSGFAKQAISELGISGGIRALKRRFEQCRCAYDRLLETRLLQQRSLHN